MAKFLTHKKTKILKLEKLFIRCATRSKIQTCIPVHITHTHTQVQLVIGMLKGIEIFNGMQTEKIYLYCTLKRSQEFHTLSS